MPLRFQLDENVTDSLAAGLRRGGFDVATAAETGRLGISDEEQLRLAALDNRCLVTADRDGFWILAVTAWERNLPHAGVLILTHPPSSNEVGAIVRALARVAEEFPDGLPRYFTNYVSSSRNS